MSQPRDPLKRLRKANPVPPDQAPRADSPQARVLFQRIVEQPPGKARKRWWTGRAWILLPAILVLAGAATYVILRPVTEPISVACFQGPDVKANRAIVPPTDNPVAACRDVWQPGGEFNPSGEITPPPLTACVLNGGALGVFPSLLEADTCTVLGLAHPATARLSGLNRAVLDVQAALAKRFLGACVSRNEAVALARAELSRHGLSDWRIDVPLPFTSTEPCASVAFDLEHRTLRLIPVHPSFP